MDLNGEYSSSPDDTDYLTGTTDTTVSPARKSYEGFTAPSAGTVTIKGDGTGSLSYKYERNKYTVSFTGDTHARIKSTNNTKPRTLYYGAKIGTLPTEDDLEIDDGYELIGWEIAD